MQTPTESSSFQHQQMSESPNQLGFQQPLSPSSSVPTQNNLAPANQMPPPPLPPPPGSTPNPPPNQQDQQFRLPNSPNPSQQQQQQQNPAAYQQMMFQQQNNHNSNTIGSTPNNNYPNGQPQQQIPVPNPSQQHLGAQQPQPGMPLNQISNNFNTQQHINPSHHHHHLQHQQQQNSSRLCAQCNQAIRDRYLLQCLDRFWHVQCLKCQVCKVTLSELGEKCFTRDQMILCRDDYVKMFGGQCVGGMCETCQQSILGNEHVMRAFNSVYHVDCFACNVCRIRLKTGDKYCYVNGRIYCEKDNPQQNVNPNHGMPMQQLNQNSTGPPSSITSPPTTTTSKKGNSTKRSKNATAKAIAAQQQAALQQQQQQQQLLQQQQQHHQMQQQQHQLQQQQHHQLTLQQQQHQQQQLLFQDQEQQMQLQQQQLI